MGFHDWAEGCILIFAFLVIISIPCVLIAMFGSKMINDLGNHPTQSAQIQMAASWKVLLVEIGAFVLLGVFLKIFS